LNIDETNLTIRNLTFTKSLNYYAKKTHLLENQVGKVGNTLGIMFIPADIQLRLVDKWLLRLGFSYDTSSFDSDDCTPEMPIDRLIHYATVVKFKCSDRLSTVPHFVYADYVKAKIDNTLAKGDLKRKDFLFYAINANWKF